VLAQSHRIALAAMISVAGSDRLLSRNARKACS
jgi:hypothetical protein